MEATQPAQTVLRPLVSFLGGSGPFPIVAHQLWPSRAISQVFLALTEQTWKALSLLTFGPRTE